MREVAANDRGVRTMATAGSGGGTERRQRRAAEGGGICFGWNTLRHGQRLRSLMVSSATDVWDATDAEWRGGSAPGVRATLHLPPSPLRPARVRSGSFGSDVGWLEAACVRHSVPRLRELLRDASRRGRTR